MISSPPRSASRTPRASVVIPAHNEEAVIDRCLQAILAGATPGELEVAVVCNGCTDRTASIVRRSFPGVKLVQLDVASKPAALNAGDRAVSCFPRFYVDADIELPIDSLRTVRSVLDLGEVQCAAPCPVFHLADRPAAIRAFYAVWRRLPYLGDRMVGSGVYALSQQGRARFAEFPPITADDQFIMQLFERHERDAVDGASFTIHPPQRLRGLINMRSRAYRGNSELARSGLARTAPPGRAGRALLQAARSPAMWPGIVVFVVVNGFAKARAMRNTAAWERDESARS